MTSPLTHDLPTSIFVLFIMPRSFGCFPLRVSLMRNSDKSPRRFRHFVLSTIYRIPFERFKKWRRTRSASNFGGFEQKFPVLRKRARNWVKENRSHVDQESVIQKSTQKKASRNGAQSRRRSGHLVFNFNSFESVRKIWFTETNKTFIKPY